MKQSVPNLITFVEPDFIHVDDRGSLTQLVSKEWTQVNYITSEAGSFRGGHYHKKNKELFYVVDGRFELLLEFEGQQLQFEMGAKDMFVIHKNVVHSFSFLDETALISMYDNGVEEIDGMDIYQGKEL